MPSRVWWRSKHTSFMTKRKSPKKETAGCGNVDRINCHHYAIFVSNTHKKVSFHLLSRLLPQGSCDLFRFFEDFFLVPTGHPKWETEQSVFMIYKVLDNKAKEPSILKNVQSMSNESKHVLVHSSIEYIDFSFISRTSRYHYETAMQVQLVSNLKLDQ